MWRLFVFTVFVFSSTTTACYKQLRIENNLDSRVQIYIRTSCGAALLFFCVHRNFDIEKGSVWNQTESRGLGLISRIYACTKNGKDGKCEKECQGYSSSGTGYWHFKVEYKEHGECKVTRIGGLS